MSDLGEHLKQRAKLWQPWIDDGEFTEMGFSVETMKSHQKLDIEAADRIAALEAKVRELEDKLRFKQMDCDTWQRDSEGKLEDRTRLEHELTASRQQVERLVEALNGLRSIVRHFWNDDHPEIFALDAACEKADEALAAVEKERHNEELTGAKPVGEASGSAQG